jgi:hypothetical protein
MSGGLSNLGTIRRLWPAEAGPVRPTMRVPTEHSIHRRERAKHQNADSTSNSIGPHGIPRHNLFVIYLSSSP